MTSAGLKPKHVGAKHKKGTLSELRAPLFARPAKVNLILGAVLVVVTLVLYYPAIHHPFVNYDDDGYVTENPHTQEGLSGETVAWAFTSYDQANWHPLTWLSHALDCQLFQLDPAGHHGTNIALHAVNAVLLFWILLQATGFAGRSFMVAALFALHPINVESVVWIAERKNLLSLLFLLLALAAYRWYAREPRVGRYCTVALLFVLGLMAKPQVITLPFLLLLWDYWPLRRMEGVNLLGGAGPRDVQPALAERGLERGIQPNLIPGRRFSQLLLEKLPLVALSAISAAITMRAQRVGGGLNPELTLSTRLANAVVSYVRYVGKAFWPSNLAPMYPHPGNSLPTADVLVASLFLLLVTTLVIVGRRHGYLPVGWLWFLGALIPMIGLVQVGRQAMADRYAYLPCIGLFIMICWGVTEFAEQWHVSPKWLAGASAAVLLVLVVVAHRQIGYWGDNVALWSHTLQVTNRNYEAEEDLGEALLARGEQQEALPHFRQASAIDPSRATPYMYMGVYDQQRGKLQEAIEQYHKALNATTDINPNTRAQALANMGHAYLDLGNIAKARESLQESVGLNSHKMEVWIDLGLAKQRSGDLAGAIEAYSEGTKIKPTDVGYLLLAHALEQSGRQTEAVTATRQAKVLSRNFPEAQQVAERLVGH